MLNIGIIGAENSHCRKIAILCNVEKRVAARVTALWGENRKAVEGVTAFAPVKTVVRDWREMLGQVDAVMIDHRCAEDHYEPAHFFLEQGVPCFVDKPFTHTLREGVELCRIAKRNNVPLTSFSVIAQQKSFKTFHKQVRNAGKLASLSTAGWADLKGRYGGVAFYGFHQVDTIIELCGTEVETVSLRRHGRDGTGIATLHYRAGPMVTMHCLNNSVRTFHWSAVGENEFVDSDFAYDADPYLTGTRLFTRMFRTGKEPFKHERILAPIAVLETLRRSLRLGGKPLRVPPIRLG
jgi:predicted dehydrogenase